jgi:hypothetical protein
VHAEEPVDILTERGVEVESERSLLGADFDGMLKENHPQILCF